MTNKRVVEMAEINKISCEVPRRRRNGQDKYSGESREDVNDCFTVLGWTPESRRTRGRPKTTWGRTVERERGKIG